MVKNYFDEIKTAENYITDVLPELDTIIRQTNKELADLKFIKNLAIDIKDILNKALKINE